MAPSGEWGYFVSSSASVLAETVGEESGSASSDGALIRPMANASAMRTTAPATRVQRTFPSPLDSARRSSMLDRKHYCAQAGSVTETSWRHTLLSMSRRQLSLGIEPPPAWLGIVAMLAAVGVGTLLVYPLK